MASIKTLKDSTDETIYPQTLTKAVLDLNNQTLDNLLASKAKIQIISQENYDALSSYDLNTIYIIEE